MLELRNRARGVFVKLPSTEVMDMVAAGLLQLTVVDDCVPVTSPDMGTGRLLPAAWLCPPVVSQVIWASGIRPVSVAAPARAATPLAPTPWLCWAALIAEWPCSARWRSIWLIRWSSSGSTP